eukprot:TRINITY_DN15865_c0_g1::TRINITY_DN15865_c0_g1_i1::g.22542::m.22542 TRINITY_DN15865_c0_g1::TRINITY_DN15865_c0_g1_i1::g.22542  ORF type:complete len:149 (-),score=37.37,sp/Q8GY31/CDC25_ARATH/37.08/8e-12,Rhodanese/PF00581.15/8.3e-15,Phage_hub_GP28/PF11110.3/0.021 TRINITY_DN15865_c0_g1_i1:272-718(-)
MFRLTSRILARNFERVPPKEVSGYVQRQGRGVVIIDVRDDETDRGMIKGSKNVPFGKFETHVQALVEDLKDKDTAVFFCAHSVRRGPNAATAFIKALEASNPNSKVQVKVMDGGFTQWIKEHLDEDPLHVNVDKQYWQDKIKNDTPHH